MPAWTTARDQARHNEQSTLARGGIDDDPNVEYARRALRQRVRAGYGIASKKCAWCGAKRQRDLRTGSVDGLAVLFCPDCADRYHYARGDAETHEDALRVHLDDGRGLSRCGLGYQTTRDRRAVTCQRCRNYSD